MHPARVQVSSSQFNFACDMVLSGSIDQTCRLWDVRTASCLSVKEGHTDEVLDVSFNSMGSCFASASSDGTARMYSTDTGLLQHECRGHDGEVSKVRPTLDPYQIWSAASQNGVHALAASAGG